jgi:hypothetical protein
MKPAELYILNQPEPFREIIHHLQVVIEKEIPNLQLFFKWKLPYYYLNGKGFCFINASHKNKYVDLAFNQGYQLQNNVAHLIGEKRNTFKSLRYAVVEEIDYAVLVAVLQEARALHKNENTLIFVK